MSPLCICQFAPLMWKIDRAGREQQRRRRERGIKQERTNHIVNFLPFLSLSLARTHSFSVCLSPFLLFRVIQKEEKNEPKRRKKQSIAQHHYRRHRHTRAKLSPSCFAIRSLLHLSLSFIRRPRRFLRCRYEFNLLLLNYFSALVVFIYVITIYNYSSVDSILRISRLINTKTKENTSKTRNEMTRSFIFDDHKWSRRWIITIKSTLWLFDLLILH